jgi:hypothetical protein
MRKMSALNFCKKEAINNFNKMMLKKYLPNN